VPEIARFYGLVIRLYYDDHLPPHFHVSYAGHDAKVDIDTLSVFDGKLPPRALGLAIEWASLHQDELRAAFRQAAANQLPPKIKPLP
jgi:hypothetical protein